MLVDKNSVVKYAKKRFGKYECVSKALLGGLKIDFQGVTFYIKGLKRNDMSCSEARFSFENW